MKLKLTWNTKYVKLKKIMSDLEAYDPENILETEWPTWIDVPLKSGEFHG